MRRYLRAIRSLAAIVRAGARVGFHHHRLGLPELVGRLRSTPEGRCGDPALDAAVLERLLPFLPPFGAGRCIKRSYFLLDLWSRAGLAPSFHLGIRGALSDRAGHAWIRTKESGFATFQPPDVVESFRA